MIAMNAANKNGTISVAAARIPATIITKLASPINTFRATDVFGGDFGKSYDATVFSVGHRNEVSGKKVLDHMFHHTHAF